MDFVKTIRLRLSFTRYRLAKELRLPVQSIDWLEERGKTIRPETLCELRRMSRMSWGAFGKILDAEFLEE